MLSCAGNPHVRTPALDRLAGRGVRFDRAYCTHPACAPSRLSLFTGRMPSILGMQDNQLPQDAHVPEPMLRRGPGWLLQRAGYRCMFAGKQHLPGFTAEQLGFEVISRDQRDGLADTCAQVLSQPQEQPFLLVSAFINPHDICYMAIRDFASTEREHKIVGWADVELRELDAALDKARASGDLPPLPANFEPQHDEPEDVRDRLENTPFRARAREQWSEQRWREHRGAYAKLVESVDAQVGRVLDALDNGPNARDTVVIFTSDHGDMDSAHRMEHKGMFYEEATRVPLIVRPAGGAAAGRVDNENVVSNGLDLLPTLCDYAGVQPPAGLMGQSFRPLVDAQPPAQPRPCVPIESGGSLAIVSGRYKYALHKDGTRREQLYDLQNDPGEMRSAADAPDAQPALEQHRRWHAQVQQEIADANAHARAGL